MENNDQTLLELKQALEHAQAQLHYAEQLMAGFLGDQLTDTVKQRSGELAAPSFMGNSQVIEGVFNGQNMVGADGKVYTVPANYASKSKLVEGDILKLTIKSDGTFIYKQIGPVERKRMVGNLVRDKVTGEYSVLVGKRSYKVILAAVTYYKGSAGDEVVILTPEDGESAWAAVENLITAEGSDEESELILPDGSAAELPSGDAAQLA